MQAAFIDMQPAVADVFATFIDMQKVCRDMQIAFTDALAAVAREKCATFRFQRFSHAVRSRESSGNRVCRGFLAINGSRVNRDFGGSPYGRLPRAHLGKPAKKAGFPRCARGRRPYGDPPKSRWTLPPLIARKHLQMRIPELSLDLIACENRRN